MTQKCNQLSKYLAILYVIGSYLLFSPTCIKQKAVAAPSAADCVDTASYQSEYGRISAVIYAPCVFSVCHHGGSSVVRPGAAAGTRLIFKHADFSRSLCICIYKAHSLSQVSIMTAAGMQGRGGGGPQGSKVNIGVTSYQPDGSSGGQPTRWRTDGGLSSPTEQQEQRSAQSSMCWWPSGCDTTTPQHHMWRKTGAAPSNILYLFHQTT